MAETFATVRDAALALLEEARQGEILVHEFRAGKLGRISLEAPPPPRDAT